MKEMRDNIQLNRGQKLLMLYAKLHYQPFRTEDEFRDHLALLAGEYNGGFPTKFEWDLLTILQKTCRAVYTDRSYIDQVDERVKNMMRDADLIPEELESRWARLAWQYIAMLQGAPVQDANGRPYLDDVKAVPLESDEIETNLVPGNK